MSSVPPPPRLGSPARLALFPLTVRIVGLFTIAAAVMFFQRPGESTTRYPVWLALIWASLSLLRVPCRRLLLELAVVNMLVLVPDFWAIAALAVIACPLAPERGLLRLNGVDRYFVAHDYPGASPNFHYGFDVKEPLDRPALERAAFELHRQIPLARSFVREAFLAAERFESRHPWLTGAQLVSWTDPLSPDEEAGLLDAAIPLAKRPPWRITVERRAGGERLLLTIHHSLTDGTGHTLLFERLLKLYDSLRKGHEPDPVVPLSQAPRFRKLLRPRGLSWIVTMIRRHVRPMDKVGVKNASIVETDVLAPSLVRFEEEAIGREAWSTLKTAATRRQRTPNDLVVAASLKAGLAWRRARQLPDLDFRLLLPLDLRPRLRVEPGLGNCVGVVRALFTTADVESPDLAALVAERVMKGAFDVAAAIETPVNVGVLASLLPPWLFRMALRQFDMDPRSHFFSYVITTVRIPAFTLPPGTERFVGRGSVPRQPGFGILVFMQPDEASLSFFHPSASVSTAAVSEYRERLRHALEQEVSVAGPAPAASA